MTNFQVKLCLRADCELGGDRPCVTRATDQYYEETNFCGACGYSLCTFQPIDAESEDIGAPGPGETVREHEEDYEDDGEGCGDYHEDHGQDWGDFDEDEANSVDTPKPMNEGTWSNDGDDVHYTTPQIPIKEEAITSAEDYLKAEAKRAIAEAERVIVEARRVIDSMNAVKEAERLERETVSRGDGWGCDSYNETGLRGWDGMEQADRQSPKAEDRADEWVSHGTDEAERRSREQAIQAARQHWANSYYPSSRGSSVFSINRSNTFSAPRVPVPLRWVSKVPAPDTPPPPPTPVESIESRRYQCGGW